METLIIYDYNYGTTEGYVNRIKNIMKQMYGRGNFDLLRNKVIILNGDSHKSDEEPCKVNEYNWTKSNIVFFQKHPI